MSVAGRQETTSWYHATGTTVSYNSVCARLGSRLPRKIRQLKSDLKNAGFVERPDRGKVSHSFWVDPDHTGISVTIAGHDGDDAKGYQEKQVQEAIARAQAADQR